MNDNHDDSQRPHDPFAAPQPERFAPPTHEPAPQHTESSLPVERVPNPEATPYQEHVTRPDQPLPGEHAVHGYAPPALDPAGAEQMTTAPEPLLPVDPLLPPDPGAQERLALDGTSPWLHRLGE